jgi:hypothetical protein
MSTARTASRVDPTLSIPPPPPRVVYRPGSPRRRPEATLLRSRRLLDALREASLVGMAALALFWGLAELALLLLGGPGRG